MQAKKKLAELTANKRKLQQRTATMKRSLDEVTKLLESTKDGKKSK